jgi:hypothetical protein
MSEFKTLAIGAGLTLAAGAALVAIGRKRPRQGVAGLRGADDDHAAYELRLHVDNTHQIYRYAQGMRGAITKKVCRGQFDATKAAKGFRAIVDEAAKDYAREHSTGVDQARVMFPGAVRNKVAAELVADLKGDINRCLTKGDCGDAPPELAKCAAKIQPLAGARRRKRRK